MSQHSTDLEPQRTEAPDERMDRATLAGQYLAAATEHVSTLRDTSQGRDAARQVLATAGIGHTLLAIRESLAGDPAGEILAREAAAVGAEISRADGKCGVLTALTGTAAVVAASQVPHGPVPGQALLGVASALLSVATMLTLRALRPRYRAGTSGWCRWSLLSTDEIQGAADAGDDSQAVLLRDLSRIARAKYDAIRVAIDVTAVGLALLVTGLAAGVIA